MKYLQVSSFLLLSAVVGCAPEGPNMFRSASFDKWNAGDLYDRPEDFRTWPACDRAACASFFASGNIGSYMECWILNNGETGSVGHIRDGHGMIAEHGIEPDQLPETTSMPSAMRSKLDAVICDLPPSQSPTRDGDVFVVSWLTPNGPMTRTYDRTKLTAPVERLCKLLNIPPTWL